MLDGGGANNNLVQANYIGTDALGTTAIANLADGIRIINGANANLIGGTNASDRNVIAGNVGDGIEINGAGSSNNDVLGNFIGVDVTGAVGLGNGGNGVIVTNDASNNDIGNGAATGRNIISGNLHGVGVNGATSSDNRIRGNYIGTDVSGTLDVGNTWQGINNSGTNTIIGGIGEGNVISGNYLARIYVLSGTGLVIQGNYIGTNATGSAAIANNEDGISIITSGVLVGGTNPGEGNLISGNNWSGISLSTSSATGNIVQGNTIGLDAAGTSIVANGTRGVSISSSANSNTIGGAVAGARNVISGNTDGVYIGGGTTDSNTVAGNYIGTDITGTVDLGNTGMGVRIATGTGNLIGGTTALARNIISGNDNAGVLVSGVSATGNLIQGNYIGTDESGTLDLGNNTIGVWISGARLAIRSEERLPTLAM